MRHFITFKGIDSGNDLALDVSSICNSENSEIRDPRCTTSGTSAAGSASFLIGWTPDKVADPYDGTLIDRPALYRQVVDAMLTAIETKAEMQVILRDDTLKKVKFRGYIDPTEISLSRTRIPQSIAVSCRDHTTDLDKKIGYNIVREGLTVNQIVEELLELCYGNGSHVLVGTGEEGNATIAGSGTDGGATLVGIKRIVSSLPDSVIVPRFVVVADDNTTYRKVIDRLLMQKAVGYVLHYIHASNKFEIVPAIPDEVDDLQIRTINFMPQGQLVTRTGVYSHDGVLVKWPTIEERKNDNVYSEDIELTYDSTLGSIGEIVQQGAYFPEDGDITPTKQEYRKSDRSYVTGESRKQNKDIDLVYAKDAELGIIAVLVKMTNRGTVADLDALEVLSNPILGDYAYVASLSEYRGYNGSEWQYMDTPTLSDGIGNIYTDRGSVATKSLLPLSPSTGDFYLCEDTGITWCWMDNEWQRKISLFCFPILSTTDVNMTEGNPAFYPRSMWALGRNRSGGMVNLQALSVTATSVARTKVNKTTHPAIIKDPDEYEAEYVNTQEEAESFSLWLYNFRRIACTTCTWYEWEGQKTPLSKLGERVRVEYMTDSTAVFCVIQIDDTAVTRKSRKYKVTALLVSGFQTSFSGKHEAEIAPAIVNKRMPVSQVVSYANSTNGTTPPESGWSATRTIEKGKYLWTRTITTYTDSTSETTYSVVYNPEDATDAVIFDFSLGNSTYYRNGRLNISQEITLTIDVQGLTGYTLFFSAYKDGTLDNSLLDSTSNPTKLIIPYNNTCNTIKVIMSASPSGTHDDVEHSISVVDVTSYNHDFGAFYPHAENGTFYLTPDHFTVDGVDYEVIDGDFYVLGKSVFFGAAITVTPVSNPKEEGLFEKIEGSSPPTYIATDDTTIVSGKSYKKPLLSTQVEPNGIPYIRENGSQWNEMTATTENAGRMLSCLANVLSDPDIQPVSKAIYGWFENLIAKNAVIENLRANQALFRSIHVTGDSLFDGNIDSDALTTESKSDVTTISLDTGTTAMACAGKGRYEGQTYYRYCIQQSSINIDDGQYVVTTGTYTYNGTTYSISQSNPIIIKVSNNRSYLRIESSDISIPVSVFTTSDVFMEAPTGYLAGYIYRVILSTALSDSLGNIFTHDLIPKNSSTDSVGTHDRPYNDGHLSSLEIQASGGLTYQYGTPIPIGSIDVSGSHRNALESTSISNLDSYTFFVIKVKVGGLSSSANDIYTTTPLYPVSAIDTFAWKYSSGDPWEFFVLYLPTIESSLTREVFMSFSFSADHKTLYVKPHLQYSGSPAVYQSYTVDIYGIK